jgi:hypothetical protein
MRWDDLSIRTTTSDRAGADPAPLMMITAANIHPVGQPPTRRAARHDRVPRAVASAIVMMSFSPAARKDRSRSRLPTLAVNPSLRADRLAFGKVFMTAGSPNRGRYRDAA